MNIYIYLCIYIYVYLYVYIYIHIYIYIYIYIYIFVYRSTPPSRYHLLLLDCPHILLTNDHLSRAQLLPEYEWM